MARFLFAALLLSAAGFAQAPAKGPGKAAAKPSAAAVALAAADEAAAQLWFDLATFAADRGAKAAAAEACAKGAALRPEDRRGKAVAKRIAGLKTETPASGLEAKTAEIKRKIAKLADRLPTAAGEPADEEAADRRFCESFALDPEDASRRELLAKSAAEAAKTGRHARAARLAAAAALHDPAGVAAGKYAAAEESLAREDVLLIKAPDREFAAYVSLPKGWDAKKTWPVLVAVEGAGSGFQGAARHFRGVRGDRPYVVVVPCTLSNTNALAKAAYPHYAEETLAAHAEQGSRFAFDEAGLLAILGVVRERFRGEAKFCLTGFSGGGLLTSWWLLRRPDDLVAGVLAGANFHAALEPAEKPPEGPRAPVHLIVGEKDEHREKVLGKFTPGIDGQTDAAFEALRRTGYTNLRRSLLPGVGHSSCAAEVFAFCDEARGAK